MGFLPFEGMHDHFSLSSIPCVPSIPWFSFLIRGLWGLAQERQRISREIPVPFHANGNSDSSPHGRSLADLEGKLPHFPTHPRLRPDPSLLQWHQLSIDPFGPSITELLVHDEKLAADLCH